MILGVENKELVLSAVQKAIEVHGRNKDELIPILNFVNKRIGYLPDWALIEIGKEINIPQSRVFSVASFYDMLSTKPVGKHIIRFCESAPCPVVGGREVFQTLLDTLKVQPGETTNDGMWTFLTVSCLGVCGVGPVMMVDEDVFGNLTPDQIPGILAKYANGGAQ
jgi:NADH:ubiquinone oxidoreductase subunit E